jgi:hypothetical protein
MVTIKKVSVGSAFKVTAVLFALLWGIFGLFFLLFPALFLGGMSTSMGAPPEMMNLGGGFAFMTYLCGLPIYAVVGGIFGALYAVLYNVVSGWIGGLQVELEDAPNSDWGPVKPKIGDRDF